MDSIRADFDRLRPTLDRRFWLVAFAGTVVSVLLLGIPTAVIPNQFFSRMTPTEPSNLLTLVLSAPLMGLVLASYVARPVSPPDVHEGGTEWRASLGGFGAFLAIGCPICNKLVVGILGVSGALNAFAPIQPVIGMASVGLLGATAVWQLRRRARGCVRCVALSSSPAG